MKLDGDNLKIALQKSGRLAEASLQVLRSAGIDYDFPEGRLFSRCRNFPLDLLFLRDDDIPEYVQDGVADLGIVGLNVVRERAARVVQLDCLGFGACTLCIAAPQKGTVHTVFDLQGKRIATSYPRVVGDFLRERNIEARIIEIAGSVEIAPSLDIADAICDLVSTGSTLRIHDLVVVEVLMKSEAWLIAHPPSLDDGKKRETVERLRARIQSHLKARQTKYVMMNAPEDALEKIKEILPGMKSPTVVPLADRGMIAVHTAVPEEFFWDVIEKLRTTGATDILVVPVEKMVV